MSRYSLTFIALAVLFVTGCIQPLPPFQITATPILPTVTLTSGSSAPASTLVGTNWELVSLEGKNVIEGTHITLNFITERILGGFAGCNAYGGGPDSGKYIATNEGALTVLQIAVTVQLCLAPTGIMQQEEAYIQALLSAVTYRVIDDHLEIYNVAGEAVLIFAAK